VDRALVEAYAGLAARPAVHVPALYSRLGAQPLFSQALDRPLTPAEMWGGFEKLEQLLAERAPVLLVQLKETIQKLEATLETSAGRACQAGTAQSFIRFVRKRPRQLVTRLSIPILSCLG
jgi:hypothetical protein